MCYRLSRRFACIPFLLLSLPLLVASRLVVAVEVAALYEAEVPVRSQERGERQAALGEALRQVLVKVSGRRHPETNDVVARGLSRASRLLLAYDYRRVETETDPLAPLTDRPASDLLLSARFDPGAVESLLIRAGLPVWGRARPVVLLWLAVEEGALRYLVDRDSSHPARLAAGRAAQRRGLPLRLPVLEAGDVQAVRFMDVWADFADILLPASRPYAADRVLVGRLYLDAGGEWVARWTLYGDRQPRAWQHRAATPVAAVAAGIDAAADALAGQYAVQYHASADAQLIQMDVSGVDSLRNYARVMRYLEALEPVDRVMPVRLEGERLGLNLYLRGGGQALRQAIALGRVLEPDEPMPVTVTGDGPEEAAERMRYRVMP